MIKDFLIKLNMVLKNGKSYYSLVDDYDKLFFRS